MNRCQICGKNCSGTIEIFDKTFGVLNDKAKVCKSCFDCWVSNDFPELYKRVREKLR